MSMSPRADMMISASQALPTQSSTRGAAAQGTQTTSYGVGPNGQQMQRPAAPQGTQQLPPGHLPPPEHAPRPRRSAAREYALAARKRKAEQRYNNQMNPPKKEDRWICEFCEYEMYFDHPPVALTRQYEVKDRREKKRSAEKRRLLEKAKAKGRKGKKGKGNVKSSSANATHPSHMPATKNDPQYENVLPQNTEYQGDEFFDDGYDEAGSLAAQAGYSDDGEDYTDAGPPPGSIDANGNPRTHSEWW